MSDKTKSEAYWEGRRAEDARIALRDRARAALDAHPNLHDLAGEVAKQLGRDNSIKRRILDRSPGIFYGMDAAELGAASSREMALRELRELGIDPGQNDPVAILDAHHSGRQWARDRLLPGNRGSAHDSAAESSIDKYFKGL